MAALPDHRQSARHDRHRGNMRTLGVSLALCTFAGKHQIDIAAADIAPDELLPRLAQRQARGPSPEAAPDTAPRLRVYRIVVRQHEW